MNFDIAIYQTEMSKSAW